MSEYGLKIKNIEAAILYEYNRGIRDHYDYENAMFMNSLLMDYLKSIGLRDYKGDSTRDIICIKFGFGCQSYEEHVKKIKKKIRYEKDETKKERLKQVLDDSIMKSEMYEKISAAELRRRFYTYGVTIHYRDKKQTETIHYRMLYRTPGKAKQGSCMFINEKFYDRALNFMRMGIKLPEKNAPIVEIGAYAPLIASSIIDRIKIEPESILILKDVDSFFKTKVISVETDDKGHCTSKHIDDYVIKNTMFDGQALIDSSIFPAWADGYVLLRQHFCKTAAFSTNIQDFFKDYYGNRYNNAEVTDMFGRKIKVKDIKLITTDNAVKWLKFGVSFDYWAEWVKKNGSLFGIVKTAHKSKLNNLQRMSYQMVNALDMKIMPEVVKESLNYLDRLKNDIDFFIQYLKDNQSFVNDYDVLLALIEQDPDFIDSTYFRSRRYQITDSYTENFKNGRLLQEGDNLVVVGSPFAMLLHSVGEDPLRDPTFFAEEGATQCYTERFDDDEYLAEFRSPFNSRNNLGHLHNVKSQLLKKYFNIGEQCIAVNMNNTDFQDRNNGSDQDSDSIYVTNQKDIVEFAKRCVKGYPTVVNNLHQDKQRYSDDLADFAEVDSILAAANSAIGESANSSQLCLTYSYNKDKTKFEDFAAILAVLSQVAIDNAKRRYAIDVVEEIKIIKNKMNIESNGFPSFWYGIKRKNKFSKADMGGGAKQDKQMKKMNPSLICPMNYVCDMSIPRAKRQKTPIPLSVFFIRFPMDGSRTKSQKIEELIRKYQTILFTEFHGDERYNIQYVQNEFDNLLDEIKRIHVSDKYCGLFSTILDHAFQITSKEKSEAGLIGKSITFNKPAVMKILYKSNKKALLKCFSKNIAVK